MNAMIDDWKRPTNLKFPLYVPTDEERPFYEALMQDRPAFIRTILRVIEHEKNEGEIIRPLCWTEHPLYHHDQMMFKIMNWYSASRDAGSAIPDLELVEMII